MGVTAGNIILVLKVAVIAVTLLLALSLAALTRGRFALHGFINKIVFVLTVVALLGLEVIARLLYPDLFSEHFHRHGAQAALRIHLAFSLPSALLLPIMLFTGMRHRRNLHVGTGILFLLLWAGTFVTGVFYLPHGDP